MNKLFKNFIFLNIITISSLFLMTESASALSISCSVSKQIAPTYDSGNNTVNFSSNVTDGTGPFTIDWSGDLTASGNSFSETFTNPGYYSVEVTVTDSLGATASDYCPGITATAVLQYNSCAPKGEMNTHLGYESVWEANISGGISPYSMTWSGTEGLSGSSAVTNITYSTTGEKNASVANITSADGQSVLGTFDCGDSILVYDTPTELESVTCSVNDSSIRVNNNVTWSANVNGGKTPYMFTWSGTDNLSGSDSSVNKTYSSTGTKSATVSVTTADGQTLLNVPCNNTVSVSPQSSGGGGGTRGTTNDDENTDDTSDEGSTSTDDATSTDEILTNEDSDTNDSSVEPGFNGYYYISTPVNNIVPENTTIEGDDGEILETDNNAADMFNANQDTASEISDQSSENVELGSEDSTDNLNLASVASLAFDNTINFVSDFWYMIILHIIAFGLAIYLIIRR